MSVYIDIHGFICLPEVAATTTDIQPPAHFVLPRFLKEGWTEGIIKRAYTYDANGLFTGIVHDADPRIHVNATATPIPAHINVPRFSNESWTEGAISYVALLNSDGFLAGTVQNLDPRELNSSHEISFPSVSFIAPRFINGNWIDTAIQKAAVLDEEGYLFGYAENFDKRNANFIFTEFMPEHTFIVPRFVAGEWIDVGIEHAWAIDNEGYFIYDLHNIDPRNVPEQFTTVPMPGTMRKPQFIDGIWVDANPITDAENLQKHKRLKLADIERQQNAAFTRGIEFDFNDAMDTIQTRTERDLINISGVTTRAILLQEQGVTDAVIPFRAESNITYMLTPIQIIKLGESVAEHSQAIYATAWACKDAIEAAETIEELNLISWEN